MENVRFLFVQTAVALVVIAVCAAIGCGFAWLVRLAVRRLEARRLREMEADESFWGRPLGRRYKGFLVLEGFVFGVLLELLLSGCGNCDFIYSRYVPWTGVYNVILTGVVTSSVGFATCDVTLPKGIRKGAVLIGLILSLAFAIHVADAFTFWGNGASLRACLIGYAERTLATAVHVGVFCLATGSALPLVLLQKAARRDLTRAGLTCGGYLKRVVGLIVWLDLLGLLVYEMLILIWLNLVL